MKRIFLVEDDPIIVDLIKSILTSYNYDVIHTSNGADALSIAKQIQPDLVLLDVMLPGLDGYSIQTKLGEDDDLRKVPVIVITAKSQLEDVFRQTSNFAGFLTKPFKVKDLLDNIERVLSSSPG